MSRPVGDPALDGFRRLAVAHAASVGADTLIAVALAGSIFFNVSADAARPKVLLYLFITMVPFAIVAPVIGPLLDRTKSGLRIVIAGTALGRAALCSFMVSDIESLLFYPEAFGALALSKAYTIAKSALVPIVVQDERALVEANSRLALLGAVAGIILAPMAAGVQAIAGAPWVLRVAAAVNLGCAFAALRIPKAKRLARPPTPAEEGELKGASIFLASTGMAFLRAAVGFLTFVVAFALKRDGEPSWMFGVALASGAGGGLLGALVAPRLRRRVQEEMILAGALAIPAVVCVTSVWQYGRGGIAAAAASVAFGASAGRLAFDSLVQRDAAEAARGRTFARFETRFQLAWVAGAFIPAALPMPGRVGFGILSGGLAFACFSYRGAVRAVRSPRSHP
jgi:hypothetical protein